MGGMYWGQILTANTFTRKNTGARIWSGIILIPSNQNFHDPASPVLITIKTWLRLANPDAGKTICLLPATSTKKTSKMDVFLVRVAGRGFAPRSQGYEPCELLLLHPAISITSVLYHENQ